MLKIKSINISSQDKAFIITLFVMCTLYVMPIFLADRWHYDDMIRSDNGMYAWSRNGRPLADLIMYAISFGGDLINFSPLPLALSVLAYSFSALIFYRNNLYFIGPKRSAIIFFVAFANPFFLENISYDFDCLPMTLSIAFLLLAFCKIKHHLTFFLFSVLCVFLSLCSYQASIGIFISLSIVEFSLMFSRGAGNSELYSRVLSRLSQLVVAYIAYHYFIANTLISGEYNETRSVLVGLNLAGFSTFMENIESFFSLIKVLVVDIPLFIPVLATSFVALALFGIAKNNKYNSSYDVVLKLVLFLGPVISLLSSFVHLSLMFTPVIMPRTLSSFTGFLFLLIVIPFIQKPKSNLLVVFSIVIAFFLMSFSYSYGATQKAQKEYDEYISFEISHAIKLADPAGNKTIYFLGNQPSSLVRNNAISKYKTLELLVPIYISDGWGWGRIMLNHYGLKSRKFGAINDSVLNDICNESVTLKMSDFNLLETEKEIVIAFRQPLCTP